MLSYCSCTRLKISTRVQCICACTLTYVQTVTNIGFESVSDLALRVVTSVCVCVSRTALGLISVERKETLVKRNFLKNTLKHAPKYAVGIKYV